MDGKRESERRKGIEEAGNGRKERMEWNRMEGVWRK